MENQKNELSKYSPNQRVEVLNCEMKALVVDYLNECDSSKKIKLISTLHFFIDVQKMFIEGNNQSMNIFPN